MIDLDRLDKAMADLADAINDMNLAIALSKLTKKENPYHPLVRVLCKLGVFDWPT